MTLFDAFVDRALAAQSELAPLRVVVEKELLHHDILREMSAAGLLAGLTFIGGTCLRACYGSNRLSEDLDFTGGQTFRRESLETLGEVLVRTLEEKYGLNVAVAAPIKDAGPVDTWRVKVTTRPGRPDLPEQHIHVDVCAVPSYQRRPMVLRQPYAVDMGTAGLIIQAQRREEILADKWIAFALRPNRVKHRDLWDIAWLMQQGVDLPIDLVAAKVADHRQTAEAYSERLATRVRQVCEGQRLRGEFVDEIRRFLPVAVVAGTVEKPEFWAYLTDLIARESERVLRHLAGESPSPRFRV